MDQQLTRGEQNLLMLQSLISSSEKFYVWCYDAEGRFATARRRRGMFWSRPFS